MANLPLYVITDYDDCANSGVSSVSAYSINTNGGLNSGTPTANNTVPGVSIPEGLTIDTFSHTLFMTATVTQTDAPSVQMVQILDENMNKIGSQPAPGATTLGGIVMDESKGLLYTVDQNTNVDAVAKLYIYQFDRIAKTLTPVPGSPFKLQPPTDRFSPAPRGIALDTVNKRLYVTNSVSFDVYVYDTSNWPPAVGTLISAIDNETVTINTPNAQGSTSVAIDAANQFLYTGDGWEGNNPLLVQRDLKNPHKLTNEKTADVSNGTNVVFGLGVQGLAVDPGTGYVYVSNGYDCQGGGNLLVYRPSDFTASPNTLANQSFPIPAPVSGNGNRPGGLAIPSSWLRWHYPFLGRIIIWWPLTKWFEGLLQRLFGPH